jgi:uncharacterized membrane protein (Fun14 family)
MKDFLTVLITLILSGFAIGIAYLSVNYTEPYGVLYIPWTILVLLWGLVLSDYYFKNK